MKLLHQLNTAFTLLIVIVMSITAFFLYSLLLNTLIADEQRQLEDKGDLLIELLNEPNDPLRISQLQQLVQDSDLRLLMFDRQKREILFSTLPAATTADWANRYDEELHEEDMWESDGESYVVHNIDFTPQNNGVVLVLATPLDDLQAIQTMFAMRMVAVLLIGLIIAIIISYFFTKRLVTPLTRLKHELKKIERRQFSDLQAVNATGEIKDVERGVRQMAEELDKYIRSQKLFFQNASHELKTPLMSIQGYAEGIKDGVFTGESAEKGLKVMINETERLKKIVNEMILLAKLDSNENIYHPENVEAKEMIRQAKDRLFPLANEKGIVLQEYLESCKLYIDPEKVLQALINIIGNAVRHAHHQVTVSSEIEDQNYVIRIEDDGEGISEQLLPQLFQRFIKGKEGETGLGLAISRAIIERSGGSIHAANRTNHTGAIFTIRMPVPVRETQDE
ncbi:sensor histidine kinase [Thalassobacillus hwangdonensis]|uniref:histidine kinase n=1 Tax=Thalassobacillus hwangdonensis TaxID=546108 RepID=A0ABW3L2I5_9BACI